MTEPASLPAIGMLIAVASAPGNNVNPVSHALKPKTVWKNSGSTKFSPNKPKPLTTPIRLATVNGYDLKTRKSTKGYGSRSSRITNAPIPKTATHDRITIVLEPNQSSRWPRSRTYCSEAMPAVMYPRPSQSAPRSGFLMYDGSAMYRNVIHSASTPIGMLMKKISGHEKLSTSQPPNVGPIAGPTIAPSPKTAIACPRFSTG